MASVPILGMSIHWRVPFASQASVLLTYPGYSRSLSRGDLVQNWED